ncbi:MAG TPA: radical SAM protein, partial [Bacteriovoracaceae bacterium]|nr:radical SAM protein [Bacteriovoracaceae bacterium]
MNNWKTEFQTAFKTLPPLYEFLEWHLPEKLQEVIDSYALFIPRTLATRIKKEGPDSILARQFLPDVIELSKEGLGDPIGDRLYSKAPQLIHRYSSRALFTPTTVCPVHCRYCFRKNELNEGEDFFNPNFTETINYLKEHPEISEIIFTGGDPFTLSDERIDFYLQSFAQVESIKDIRFHTRYPVILPQRITNELTSVLKKHQDHFRTISIAIHCNHLLEIDQNAKESINRLKDFNLLSQTVLLKNIN